MPRRLLITMAGGVLLTAAVGLVLLVRGATVAGVFLLVAPALVTGANVMMIKRSSIENQPGAPQRRGSSTGRRLVPYTAAVRTLPGHTLSWTGGGNVAARVGRMNATWPLAVLEAREATLSLRFRPKLISTMAGTDPLRWEASDLAVVYPVRGRLLGFNRGVAIESTTRALAYFWTMRPEPVLTALAEHGMPVDWQERNIRLWR